MKKNISFITVTLASIFSSSVFGIEEVAEESSNTLLTILVCFAIATGMTYIYLNAVTTANKNAKKYQKDMEAKAKKEAKEKTNKKKDKKK